VKGKKERPFFRITIFKALFALFLLVLIPTYWVSYGPGNFLWTSDIALFMVFLALLLENQFIASMAIVGYIIYEIYWNIDFLLLLLSLPNSGVTDYMLYSAKPLWIRLLSLFHVALPPLMIWLIYRLGYNKKAWLLQMPFMVIQLFLTWLLTNPTKNINLVFGYQKIFLLNMNPYLYLTLLSAAAVLIIFLTHLAVFKITSRS